MSKVIITVVCAIGICAGVALLVRYRDARSTATSALPVDSSAGARIREGVRVTSASIAAGMLGGLLTAGLGGRLLMRVIAVTSDERAQGRITEADEVVGEVSVDGTIFLVVFVGLFAGSVGAAVFALVRRALPKRGAMAGLVIAGIVGGVLARPSDLLAPESIDFRILGPTWLAAIMVISLVALLGATSGALIDTFTAKWPAPSLSVRGIAGILPLIVLALPSPLIAGAIIIVGVRGWERPPRTSGTLGRAVGALLLLAGIAGWLWMLVAAVEIAF
jgi:hypothetical protein